MQNVLTQISDESDENNSDEKKNQESIHLLAHSVLPTLIYNQKCSNNNEFYFIYNLQLFNSKVNHTKKTTTEPLEHTQNIRIYPRKFLPTVLKSSKNKRVVTLSLKKHAIIVHE